MDLLSSVTTMDVSTSPQLMAVGEDSIANISVPKEVAKQSYAATIQNKQSAPSKTELCPIFKEHGETVIQFTREEVDNFIMEEGLHQAAVLKFSYSRPNLPEVRRMFSSQFEVQGHCNIGQLEFRHLLIRFDLYNDYVHFLSKSTGYLKSKGDEFFFRTFPWTLDFNLKEETSMAVVWISLPGLPPNFFAKRLLLSIASAVGKPLAIDKATQDRTRPNAARVKIIVDLLANHPKTVKLQILDKVCGKTVDFHQEIVFDNMPKHCVFCKHQGHDEKACRLKKSQSVAEVQAEEKQGSDLPGPELGGFDKLQGDARDFLNANRSGQGIKELQERKVSKQVWNVKIGQGSSAVKVDNIEKEIVPDLANPNGISSLNPSYANVHDLVEAAVSNVKTNQCGSAMKHGNIENLNQSSQFAEMDILGESRQLSCENQGVSTDKLSGHGAITVLDVANPNEITLLNKSTVLGDKLVEVRSESTQQLADEVNSNSKNQPNGSAQQCNMVHDLSAVSESDMVSTGHAKLSDKQNVVLDKDCVITDAPTMNSVLLNNAQNKSPNDHGGTMQKDKQEVIAHQLQTHQNYVINTKDDDKIQASILVGDLSLSRASLSIFTIS